MEQHEILKKELIEIPINVLTTGRNKDITVFLNVKGKPVLYKEKHLILTPEKLETLKENRISYVYVYKNDLGVIIDDLEKEVTEIMAKERPELPTIKKIIDKLEGISEIVLKSNKKNHFIKAERVSSAIANYIENNPRMAYLTAFTLKKDFRTAVHITNVYSLVSGFAYHLGFRSPEFEKIVTGAFFHDTGKIKVPDEILKKPSILKPEEYEILKKHTIWGYEILKDYDLNDYAHIAYEHHELLDGSGYPRGLMKDEISLEAQIVQICDIYEALIGLRPYRNSSNPFSAMTIIRDEFVLRNKVDKNLFIEFVIYLYRHKI